MTGVRRVNDRRRRVLFTSANRPASPVMGASNGVKQDLRSARRPQEAYGSRVKRRLRARWYSLVPVRRSSLLLVTACSLLFTLIACIGHYYAATSTFLLQHPEIAQPLKLDQRDSFGRLLILCFLVSNAAMALMIYQLRRYRNDDFPGHYRLWRIVLVSLALASINTVVELYDWSGSIIDALIGRRVFFAGNDWVRLILTVGGTTIAAKLILEMRKLIPAAVLVGAATILFLVPQAAKWQLIEINSTNVWMLVTCASLIGANALFIGFVTNLRSIYQDVRQIDEGSAALKRLQRANQQRQIKNDSELEEETEQEGHQKPAAKTAAISEPEPKPEHSENHPRREKRFLQIFRSILLGKNASGSSKPSQQTVEPGTPQATAKKASPGIIRRFFTRMPSTNSGMQKPPNASEQKRSRLSWTKKSSDESGTSDGREAEPPVQTKHQRQQKRARKPDSHTKQTGQDKQTVIQNNKSAIDSQITKKNQSNVTSDAPSNSDSDVAASEDTDWSSLSKSERRRLRKQMKRQRRAA